MSELDKILINAGSRKQAESFLKKPSSSVLLLGAAGSGKLNLALLLAKELLNLRSDDNLTKYAHFLHIKRDSSKRDISIDDVRRIIKLLQLKVPGTKNIRRVILVEGAQDLSIEAQNALLKILEEPPTDSVFILTAPVETSLLPTVVSRCQVIYLYPVTLKQTTDFYGSRYESKEVKAAWRLSQGASALLNALLIDDMNHPFKQAIEQVKKFLAQEKYERVITLEEITKDKDEFRLFLDALTRVLAVVHRVALGNDRKVLAQKLLSDRKMIRQLISGLEVNANSRIVNLNLLLNLKS